MHEQNVRALAGPVSPEVGDTGYPEPSPKRQNKWLVTTLISVSAAALAVGLTYSAIVNDWMPSVTGLFYTESEYDSAIKDSFEEGEDTGYAAGFDQGETVGFADGETAGFEQGYAMGTDEGYATGVDEGYSEGYDIGYAQGESGAWDAGYDIGYLDGWAAGWTDGCTFLFDGLGTDRVGDWWDYYYSSYYGSYFNSSVC